ncbi:TetR family transcriptional regulator C-terminal domain-containing protein [Donghicola sp.]|uniref:TetR family transcriptional regulator C-terminal domain-containing protein n=1 Tax=Donghicola sp. TaxID=1929294 RepID=UPI0025F9F980|nr:TetR family transcriptional regulator C-terminal domain-containing protein [Donghicola sp.]MCT4577663.1 TetR family transcriptional regulator C-terminal domain-containing protein [Donghicola sp.]
MTRIQRKNTEAILEAALVVFSQYGFRGSTLDQIAKAAGLSKPNLLYYFKSKEAIFTEVLEGLLDNWLDPLREMKEDGDAIEEILAYMKRKLQMSRDFPRESRLFANEIIQGAPRMMHAIEGELKELVDEKVKIIRKWSADGRIAEIDPYHLIFSIWSLTQHYADFDVQVRAILREDTDEIFDEAESYLTTLFTRMLTP